MGSNMNKKWVFSLVTGLVMALIALALTGCGSTSSTSLTSTSTTEKPIDNPEIIEIVSVLGPLTPINPGGPNIEIILKNVSNQPVTALSADFHLNQVFSVTFDVSTSNPLLPGKTVSARCTLIGAGFSDNIGYSMVINGAFQDGQTFSLNQQVQIQPSPSPSASILVPTHEPSESNTQTPPDSSTGLAENALDGSRWKLLTLKGKPPVTGSYISLNFLNGELWGSAGLNTYGAKYTTEKPGKLVFSEAMITLLGGPQNIIEQEKEYIRFFQGGGISYNIIDNRLEIFDPDNPQDSLVFERLLENPADLFNLTGTYWHLTDINDKPIPAELSITLSFDKAEASGTAGCFVYQLPYHTSLNPDNNDNIRWGISSHRTGELPLELESIASRYIDMIRLASGFKVTEDKLEILTARGDTLAYKLVSMK